MGIGAAMTGLRPVIEGMNMGFQLLAFNQISNNLKERLPDEDYICNLEEAEMVRPGEHVTILTYSRMRYHVMQAAKTLANKGYDPEVINIRSLKPFDVHTIGNSVKKTHRVLIVEECMRTCGIGASLTSAINEDFQDYLDSPYAGTLEEWTVVQPAQIVTAVEQLCQLFAATKTSTNCLTTLLS
ncbi:C-terminal/Pyruvate-ferredoxin oxidoreductase [Parasponia andersonii]|uniref:pyruvate dehydrogenase (acetyl-transferring) n=1 Tax=Parasponia andersonii TaxID=3476 RepID=A0A2P5C0Q6_PARAD|nr:C-terminal/Pyruvate-ferredoxin oxidoreductase [Parasponia andersonii]